MRKRWQVILMVVFGSMLFISPAWAAKGYITDSFRISLRRGPSIENKILRFIPSGTPVEIFEGQDGWNRVRLLNSGDGILEGWVLNRYLIKRLPWEEQVALLKSENARLKEELAQIDRKWVEKLEHELSRSKEIRHNYQAVLEEAQKLNEENDFLKSSKRNKWFTAGGLVLLSGLLVGLLLGKEPRRRRLSF